MNPQLAAAARKQAGVFSRDQARAAGHSDDVIERRLARGDWLRVSRNVFAHSSTPLTHASYCHGALVHCGPQAIVGYAAAARVLRLPGKHAIRPVDVLLPQAVRIRDPLVRTHRVVALPEPLIVGGIRVTSWARTAVDIGLTLMGQRRRDWFASVLEAHTPVTIDDLYDEATSAKGRPGARGLWGDISALDPDLQSTAEKAFAAALTSAGLPLGVAQYVISDAAGVIGRVDRAWPAARLVAEVDGYAWHSDATTFQADRVRQNRLLAAQWRVLRFAAREVFTRPAAVAAVVADQLARSATSSADPGKKSA